MLPQLPVAAHLTLDADGAVTGVRKPTSRHATRVPEKSRVT
jgi:hypothetical protein